MRRVIVGAPALLHLGLEDVGAAVGELLSKLLLVGAEHGPVAGVEFLDHLKRPPAREDVAPDQLVAERVGEVRPVGGFEVLGHLVEEQVCAADQLVKRVEVTARAFERLERLRHLPGGVHRRVRGVRRPRVLVIEWLWGHRLAIPKHRLIAIWVP